MSDDFVHLHTHSDHSKLDGCGRVKDYVAVAAERGSPAIGFSEHGTMRGIHELTKVAAEADVKPIYGIEFYVCDDMARRGLTDNQKEEAVSDKGKLTKKEALRAAEDREGIRKRWHLTVWAKTQEGLRNLYKLSSKAWLDGYYYRPRIDLDALEAHGDGLTVATGCLGSPINNAVLDGQVRQAETIADRLYERFKEDLWLEVMPHDMDEQRTANRFALDLRERYSGKVRLLATQDAHYVDSGDWQHHEVLLCIGTGGRMSDPDRFKFPGPPDYYFKDRAAMEESFTRSHGFMSAELVKEALDSTMEIGEAASATITLDRFKCLLPPVDMPEKYNGDDFGYLYDLCKLGWKWREISGRASLRADALGLPKSEVVTEYAQRLARELATLRDRKIAPYFLLVRDIYEFARRQEIACGPGRGSSAGSLVAFLLGITAVDPIEHGLMFERFISPARVDMPDIDMDFEDVRREEILEYVRSKYGHEQVSQISTMGQLSARQCIDDVCRVYDLPYMERKRLTSEIGSGETIDVALDRSPVLKKLAASHPFIMDHALALEGMNKTPGIHAAGVVTSPVPLMDVAPLETREHKKKRIVVTALDMYGVADFGLLKLDILGLRTMTVVRMATERIAEGGEVIDMEKVPLDDAETLQAFTDQNYVGVFQFDSASAVKVSRGAEFKSFNDISIYNALNRPGTTRSGLAEEYSRRRDDPGSYEDASYHEWTKHITGETLGIILYQEQVIRVLTDVAGYNAGDADELRRKIGKSLGADEIRKEAGKFVAGALETHPGMPQEAAEQLMEDITQFGAYGFNMSHSVAYGIISYWCQWLKVHHPLAFYWALLCAETSVDTMKRYVADARSSGIRVVPADVNRSGSSFSIDEEDGSIVGSLEDLKGVGPIAARAIEAAQPFADMADFIERSRSRATNRKAISVLIKAGAFRDMVPNAKWLIENLEGLWKIKAKRPLTMKDFTPPEGAEDYDAEDRLLLASEVSPIAAEDDPFDLYLGSLSDDVSVELAHDPFADEEPPAYCWVGGIVVDVSLFSVGTGDVWEGRKMTSIEKARSEWGKRTGTFTFTSSLGTDRVRIDDVSAQHPEIVQAGKGQPLIAYVSVDKQRETLRAISVVNLATLRATLRSWGDPSVWDALLAGREPAELVDWGSKAERRRRMSVQRVGASSLRVTGIVAAVREKVTRSGSPMAIFHIIGPGRTPRLVFCFDEWVEYRKHLLPGAVVSMVIMKSARSGWILGRGPVRVHLRGTVPENEDH